MHADEGHTIECAHDEEIWFRAPRADRKFFRRDVDVTRRASSRLGIEKAMRLIDPTTLKQVKSIYWTGLKRTPRAQTQTIPVNGILKMP
jgi:hypothetical protein